ncbi:MAG TPA: glycosyl hydrolase family 8 [Opitutaceae bacterium]|nr:glycosyl hydrolase family 8 [Opitutaceae bacterium]
MNQSFRSSILIALSLLIAASAFAGTKGAALTGDYPNLFKSYLGKTDAEVQAKLDAAWQHFFRGDPETQSLYYVLDDGTAYVPDINNRDVRSEGLSYGMMIAVQLNKQDEFDRIWRYAKKCMYKTEGPFKGYFTWHTAYNGSMTRDDGTEVRGDGPAPDGEEWFVMALFFASHRWGDGEGDLNYGAHAREILHTMMHKEDEPDHGPATNMLVRDVAQINFTPHPPGSTFTDPSYHLPSFYELWTRWTEDADDKAFLARLAPTSRQLFRNAAHPKTGLMPDYSHFDGKPYVLQRRPMHKDFRYDAWRTLSNPAMDWVWWRADPWAIEQSNRVLTFLASQGDALAPCYTLEGEPIAGNDKPVGLIAMAGAAALAADREIGEPWVRKLWEMDFSEGRYRYYSGLLHFLALLQVSGNFRVYGEVAP